MTEIGELRHRVAIQRKTRSADDGMSDYTETWATVATVWAKVEPKLGREIVTADQVVHRLSCVITFRRQASFTATAADRVIYQTRNYAILGVREVEEGRRWIELQCEEGAPS